MQPLQHVDSVATGLGLKNPDFTLKKKKIMKKKQTYEMFIKSQNQT